MRRAVRYHASFTNDLVERVRWLREHRPPGQRRTLRAALAAFIKRIAAFPGIGEEMERRGSRSFRRFTLGRPLPYVVWYHYDLADERSPVWLLMLMHEDQDRERFSPDRFE